jgi:hypothetical protein
MNAAALLSAAGEAGAAGAAEGAEGLKGQGDEEEEEEKAEEEAEEEDSEEEIGPPGDSSSQRPGHQVSASRHSRGCRCMLYTSTATAAPARTAV